MQNVIITRHWKSVTVCHFMPFYDIMWHSAFSAKEAECMPVCGLRCQSPTFGVILCHSVTICDIWWQSVTFSDILLLSTCGLAWVHVSRTKYECVPSWDAKQTNLASVREGDSVLLWSSRFSSKYFFKSWGFELSSLGDQLIFMLKGGCVNCVTIQAKKWLLTIHTPAQVNWKLENGTEFWYLPLHGYQSDISWQPSIRVCHDACPLFGWGGLW